MKKPVSKQNELFLPADLRDPFFEPHPSILFAGLDEAGRGPLAGPVTAAAVILPPHFDTSILADSKKLSEKKRAAAYERITQTACWGVAHVEAAEIDRINILQASLKAMSLAFKLMYETYPLWCQKNALLQKSAVPHIHAIADGLFCPNILVPVKSVVKADATFAPVMAASIIAKVERDTVMTHYDALYPEYGYAKHKGYPTKAHRKICLELGPSPIQRKSFCVKP